MKQDIKQDVEWRGYWQAGRTGRVRAHVYSEKCPYPARITHTRARVERFSRPVRPACLINKGFVLLLYVLLLPLFVLLPFTGLKK
jgi:hypothetical protein